MGIHSLITSGKDTKSVSLALQERFVRFMRNESFTDLEMIAASELQSVVLILIYGFGP